MLKALNKKRSANFYANQVKVLLLIVIGLLIYNNNDARFFISDQLNNASEIVRPDFYWLIKMMTETNDNIVDRDALQEAYIERLIDGMDHKSMYQFVYDNLEHNFDSYSLDELITEVEDYYPEMLETAAAIDDTEEPSEATGWQWQLE